MEDILEKNDAVNDLKTNPNSEFIDMYNLKIFNSLILLNIIIGLQLKIYKN